MNRPAKFRFGVTCENPALDCVEITLWHIRDAPAESIAALAVAKARIVANDYGVRLSGHVWSPALADCAVT